MYLIFENVGEKMG